MPQFRVINSPAFELGVWEMEMEMPQWAPGRILMHLF